MTGAPQARPLAWGAMCGRYAAASSSDELIEALEIDVDRTSDPVRSVLKSAQSPPAGDPDYNVAPSKNARVVVARRPRDQGDSVEASGGLAGQADAEGGQGRLQRQLRLLTWGLVPSWAKDPAVGARMTNARAETVFEKPAFRAAIASRRALVPADGWYEWQTSPVATDAKGKPRKQPFFMHRPDGVPITFAGLFEFWRDPGAERDDPLAWLTTFTIVTTAAEAGLERIHDRQPLVLDPDQWGAWLDPDAPAEQVQALVATQRPGRFAAYPVGRAVGNSRSNGPELLEPVGAADLVGVVDPATGEVLG